MKNNTTNGLTKKSKVIFKKSKQVITLPKNRTVGIDIGSKNIKMVAMKGRTIVSVASEPITNGVINDGVIESVDFLAKNLKACKKKLKGSMAHSTLCLTGKDIIMREIKLPQMNENQVYDNIQKELSSLYVLSSGNYVTDYRVIETINNPDTGEASMRLLVVSAPKAFICDAQKACKKAGIKLERIDVFPNTHTKLVQRIMQNNSFEKTDVKAKKDIEKQLAEARKQKELEAARKKKALEEKLAIEEKAKAQKLKQEQEKEKERLQQEKRRQKAIAQMRREAEEKKKREEKEAKEKAEKEAALQKEKEAALRKQQASEQTEASQGLSSNRGVNNQFGWYFGQELDDIESDMYDASYKAEQKKSEEIKAATIITKHTETVSAPETGIGNNIPVFSEPEFEFDFEPVNETNNEFETNIPENNEEIMNDENSDYLFETDITENVANQEAEAFTGITETIEAEADIAYDSSDDQIFEDISEALNNFVDNSENSIKEDKNDDLKQYELNNQFSNVCIVDIGSSLSNITFIKNGNYSMHKVIRYGGEYLNTAVAEKLSVDATEAANLIKAEAPEVMELINEYYDSIISELDNTIYYYKSINNQIGVECLILAGGSTKLTGIREYFSKQLNVTVYKLSDVTDYTFTKKIIKKQILSGKALELEDYMSAVAAVIKEEWK